MSLTSLQLPDFILQENLDYYWRVKFIDQNQYESAWSDFFSFRTPENSQDPDGDGIEDEFKIRTPVDLDGNGENDNLQATSASQPSSAMPRWALRRRPVSFPWSR